MLDERSLSSGLRPRLVPAAAKYQSSTDTDADTDKDTDTDTDTAVSFTFFPGDEVVWLPQPLTRVMNTL